MCHLDSGKWSGLPEVSCAACTTTDARACELLGCHHTRYRQYRTGHMLYSTTWRESVCEAPMYKVFSAHRLQKYQHQHWKPCSIKDPDARKIMVGPDPCGLVV